MFEHDKQSFDLGRYVEQTTNSRRQGKFYNPCPLCGHTDDCQITGAIYHCFSASGGTGGTIIDYLQHHDGLTQADAMEKFKFEIMGYSRSEWQQAWKREHNTVSDFTGAPQSKDSPTRDIDVPPTTKSHTETEKEPVEPVGLLTFEKAVEIFETADDRILQLRDFPTFSGMAKIHVHDSVVLAADTGAGKSSLALNFMGNLLHDYPCIYINLEMDMITVMRRLVSIESGMELDRIEGYRRDPATAEAVKTYLRAITARKPLQVIQGARYVEQIRDLVRASTAGRTEPTMVILDHSLLVNTRDKSTGRYERFTKVSEDLRELALECNVVLFILLQQSREGKKASSSSDDAPKRPENWSLKESGSWENDASQICFLWFDGKRKKIIITKNRQGDMGEINLDYWKKTQRYKESKVQEKQKSDTQDGALDWDTPIGDGTKPAKMSQRDKQRAAYHAAYNKAFEQLKKEPTVEEIAEINGLRTGTVTGWIRQFGGMINGEYKAPAGSDKVVDAVEQIPDGESPFDEATEVKNII